MPEECSPPVCVFLATWVLVWGRNDGELYGPDRYLYVGGSVPSHQVENE